MFLAGAAFCGSMLFATGGCSSNDGNEPPGVGDASATSGKVASQLDREAWFTENPETRAVGQTVASECYKLEFFGWGESADKHFTLSFPEQTDGCDRVILEYRMGAFGQGPADWDNTTMLFVENKNDGEWYEIARAFTPYGGSFGSTWSKTFYLDVTEYLPMLRGETQFRLYYGGFDATDTRAHTVTFTFDLYEGEPSRNVVYMAKMYDSSRNGNTGYRGYAYGVAGFDIEDAERMGLREFKIPAEVKSLELKVAISGHGHDKGRFPNRTNYVPRNAAEFVENTYTVLVNGVEQTAAGRIFYSNAGNYYQAGTYYYDRANWAPGNPLYVHYWSLEPVTDNTGKMTLDLNLEQFISTQTGPNAEGVAQYIVEVDLFGYDR